MQSQRVWIVTGFCIQKRKIGETDGPLGAIALAYALTKLGKEVVMATDSYSSALLLSGLTRMGLMPAVHIIDQEDTSAIHTALLAAAPDVHLLAIERPGSAKDGKRYSMSGEDISAFAPDADALFQWAQANGIRTSAIGDGGNEIGMGKIKAYVEANVYLGKQIGAALPTDNLIVAGTSNWGGHALAAVLSVMARQMLMYDDEAEVQLLEGIVEAGAVDGCTGMCSATVDGLSLAEYMMVFHRIRAVAAAKLEDENNDALTR
jgi:hypothetical protein